MKFAPAIIVASALTLLAPGGAAANDPEKRALYTASSVVAFFTPGEKAELKITAEQERGLKAVEDKRQKVWRQYVAESAKVRKLDLPGREKTARLRELETRVSEDLFRVYGEALRPEQVKRMRQIVLQVHGMELFDYPEVREALKVGDKEVKALRAAYDKLLQELAADVRAKKITQEDAARKSSAMSFGVPDRVRELLTRDQQKLLADLLGDRYYGK